MRNKKRIMSMVLVFVLLFSSIAYASSVNGSFEGFSIVNIFINGNKITGDVPAINFHGRTMVPVRLVSEELGANVQWDGNTASVYIVSEDTNYSNSTQSDTSTIKLYTKIMHQYNLLEELGRSLSDSGSGLNTVITAHLSENMTDALISDSYETIVSQFNKNIEDYNMLVSTTASIIEESERLNIDTSNMYSIFSNYSEAIDTYKIAFESANDFLETNHGDHFESYISSLINAKFKLDPAILESTDGYNHFYDLIRNYWLYLIDATILKFRMPAVLSSHFSIPSTVVFLQSLVLRMLIETIWISLR